MRGVGIGAIALLGVVLAFARARADDVGAIAARS